MPINTVEELREHLLLAIEVELSTIPPYLYAMYSIEDQESEAALLIRSVVVEEMLHATLVANLLLAVGGEPDFRSADIMPVYPGRMHHHRPPLMLHLAPCSEEVVRDLFMVIERPEAAGAPPEEDYYETLGQFYYAVEQSLRLLQGEIDLFAHPQLSRQMADPSFYGPVKFDAADSGGLQGVTDLESAIAAIEIIVHQGEGLSDERWADPAHQELTHYHKFLRIAEGRSPLGAVRPAPTNPKTADLPESLRPVSDLFNALYRYAYFTLDDLFTDGGDQVALIGRLYQLMGRLLGPVGLYLVSKPDAGPTFEVFDFGAHPEQELQALANEVAVAHPALAHVADGLAAM
jgi:hypothetical protein